MSGPVPQPPLDVLPPDAPATVEDVRASRRWTWVALAWAVAASAIAVIALISTNNNKASTNTAAQTSADVTQQIAKLQQDTNARLDAFSRRLSDKAAQVDVTSLDKRLAKVETQLAQAKSDAAKQAATVQQLQTDVKDLQQRVGNLETTQQQQQQNQGTTTTP